MPFPNLPGVPQLLSPQAITAIVTLAATPLSNLINPKNVQSGWGIYLDGNEVIKPDTYLGIDYNNESNIPSFPIENGAFGSYNKVATPYDIRIRVAKGTKIGSAGVDADLIGFLAELETIQADTNAYTIVTPDAYYLNANLKGFDYKREVGNGAAIILANLHFVQILSAVDSVTTPQPVDAATTVNTGPVSASKVSTFLSSGAAH